MSHVIGTVLESQLEETIMRALLHTQGYFVGSRVLTPELCSRLSEDVCGSAETGPRVLGSGGDIHAIALLAHSDLALELLDKEYLGALVDEALGKDVILSRAEGVLVRSASHMAWHSDFDKPRGSLSSRSFRPGITVWIPLAAGAGEIEVLRASQHLNPSKSLNEVGLSATRLVVDQGFAVLLEGGVKHRILKSESPWLCLAFVRPWIKPEVLFSIALGEERLARLGERGRRWCGAYLGLPTSVEEFLAIEAAALEGDFGRAKGSGV